MTTHYDVLGVARTATAEAIKRAYYRKARTYHPDAHAGSAVAVLDEAQRAMAQLNAAWSILSDDELRAEYDAALRTRPGRKAKPSGGPAPAIGPGFRYWMGSAANVHRDGLPRYNLAVAGATDLAPLGGLAPDGLYCLHARGAQIDDAQLRHLQGLAGLQQLDLSATPLSDGALVHLLGLDRLETLLLWDTKITDAGLALLGRLPSLRVLGVGNTPVTDAGLAGLGALTRLNILQLWGTRVRGPGLRHLFGLAELEIVSLPRRVRGRHRRRLKGALPAALVL